jgi:hypothetical protein
VADSNFSAIRARLRYGSLDEFIDGYSRFITRGGMFIPMAPAKLKPIGTTIRFQFLLEDGTTAMLGEGVVRQINGPEDEGSNVGMLVKFTKLSPDTKSLVDRVLRQKERDSAAQTHDTDDSPTAPAIDPKKAAQQTGGERSSDLTETAERQAAPDDDRGGLPPEDDLFAEPDDEVRSADSAATREGDSADAPDVSTGASDLDEPETEEPGLSAGEVFSEAEDEEEDHAEPEELSEQGPPELDEDSAAEKSAEKGGPKELGRTEAGLQIMAFDDVSDEDAEEFANFALGGEEDDVDQMFAGIFGEDGGGADDFLDDAFGGGDDEGGDPFGGALGGADEDESGGGLLGDGDDGAFGGANEDSFIADAEANQPAGDALSDDDLMLEPDDEGDLAVDEGVSPMTNELHTEDIVDEEVVEDESDLEVELEDELEHDLEEASESSAPGPDIHEQPEPPVESALDDLPQEQDLVVDDDQDDVSEEILLEDETTEDEFDEGDEDGGVDREALAQQLAGAGEPSEELVNLLGSLEDSEVEDAEIQLQQLKDDIEEQVEDTDDADEEESLESLLAVANAEIEAKQKKEEEEKDDILDNLLGDDLPPPPSENSQFDMPLPDEKTQEEKKKKKEKEKKKKEKKGGFISKLFGKD